MSTPTQFHYVIQDLLQFRPVDGSPPPSLFGLETILSREILSPWCSLPLEIQEQVRITQPMSTIKYFSKLPAHKSLSPKKILDFPTRRAVEAEVRHL
jgi:hypothetical protein